MSENNGNDGSKMRNYPDATALTLSLGPQISYLLRRRAQGGVTVVYGDDPVGEELLSIGLEGATLALRLRELRPELAPLAMGAALTGPGVRMVGSLPTSSESFVVCHEYPSRDHLVADSRLSVSLTVGNGIEVTIH